MNYFMKELPCNGCGDVETCIILQNKEDEGEGAYNFSICMSCLDEATYALGSHEI